MLPKHPHICFGSDYQRFLEHYWQMTLSGSAKCTGTWELPTGMLALLQTGLDFYESQMVGTLPAGLSNDVTSYRGNAFTYETYEPMNSAATAGRRLLADSFGEVTGGWCTGNEVGESSFMHALISWCIQSSKLARVQQTSRLHCSTYCWGSLHVLWISSSHCLNTHCWCAACTCPSLLQQVPVYQSVPARLQRLATAPDQAVAASHRLCSCCKHGSCRGCRE